MRATGSESALTVLQEAVGALARADASRLQRLGVAAGETVIAAEERAAVREQHAALGMLLVVTRRNLRLLRGEAGGVYRRG